MAILRENFRPFVKGVRLEGDELVVTPTPCCTPGKPPWPDVVNGVRVRAELCPDDADDGIKASLEVTK